MKIIVPLGGVGRRFQDCGYRRPKPLVRAMGKEIIFWTLDALKLSDGDEIYIPYNERLDHHRFGQIISLRYPAVRTLPIPDTRGASETIKICVDHFGIEGRVSILDGDTWYEDDVLAMIRERRGNLVAYFESTTPDPIYSYIRTDGDEIVEIKEKQKISDKANSGCYVFDDARRLSDAVASMDLDKPSETYTSQVIAKMMEDGEKFGALKVDNFQILGTPEQVIAFSKCHAERPKRFCFDLDNTLVTSPRVSGDYSTVEPISDTINYLRSLKSRGHTIIIYTARRMRTHGGNVGAVVADISKVTLDTLERFSIPYDEIHFGKPYAHFYVDDLMVDPRSDMNKELGFYMEDVAPRHFNKVDKGATFKKTSTNARKLAGEAFYHEWVENKCSEDIRGMFPKMLGHGDGWMETEMVRGLNFSTLYLNQILKEETLDSLLAVLKRLHEEKESESVFRSYDNFAPKFLSRIAMYDHRKFGLSTGIVEKVASHLDLIASEGFRRVMIHGDPVFSNVLLDGHGEIKLVDMRGSEGDELTVYGHELYDFAKVYQSLCGYDEVLLDKGVEVSYRRAMIRGFEKRFNDETMKKIRTITASLFLSLIPLHDEEPKYQRYVDLALGLL